MLEQRTSHLVLVVGLAASFTAGLTACGSKKDPDKGSPSGSSGAMLAPPKKTYVDFDDYKAVCTEGKGVELAPAYEKKAGTPSPFAYMYKDTAGGKTEFTRDFDSTVKPWGADDAKNAQLVACVEVVKADKDHTCEFEKGGKMDRFNTTLKIAVHEAKTGKKLGEQTVEKRPGGCPMFAFIDKGGGVTRDYGSVAAELLRVVQEHQGADVPQPTLHAETFDNACNGKPAVGAGKRTTTSGVFNPYVSFVREKEGPWAMGAAMDYDFGEQEWFNQNLKAQDNRKAPRVSLAVCLTSTRGEKADECAFSGGSKVTLYKAKWKIDVVEAATGKVIQTKEFQGKPECPVIWSSDKGTEFTAPPGDDARDWLRPIVSPK